MKQLHLLFGPDGNRRYAVESNTSYRTAYNLLGSKLIEVIKWCIMDGCINPLTLWLLQEYNLFREKEEVADLVDFTNNFIADLLLTAKSNDLKLSVRLIGEIETYVIAGGDKEVLNQVAVALNNPDGLQLNIILSYNADQELQRALTLCQKQGNSINFASLAANWSIEPVDLFLRTGQPNGFVNLSSYWPLIERGRIIGISTYPQRLSHMEFASIIEQFRSLKDSVRKVFSDPHDNSNVNL